MLEYNCFSEADVFQPVSWKSLLERSEPTLFFVGSEASMFKQAKYIVVDTSVLPEIFEKVLEVKKLVANQSERSFSSACKTVGISRSAFYKYRDFVFAYDDKMTQKIINLSLILRDQAGILSSALTVLYEMQANILTVNQNIPADGVAAVSISLKMKEQSADPRTITHALKELDGVVSVKLLSGE